MASSSASVEPSVKAEEKEDLRDFIYNPEDLFVGNLHRHEPESGRFHHWCLFLSSTRDQITDARSVSRVEYELHPSFRPSKRVKRKPPFAVDCTGWGVFSVTLTVHFKPETLRDPFVGRHMLSFESPTSVTDLQTRRSQRFDRFLLHSGLPQTWNPTGDSQPMADSSDGTGFVKATSKRLLRNLIRMTAPLEFIGFQLDFASEWLPLVSTKCPMTRDIPTEILALIADFCLLRAPVAVKRHSQDVFFTDCNGGSLEISSDKIKGIELNNCSNMSLTFKNIISTVQLISCKNITLKCTELCFFFRNDKCEDIEMSIRDTGASVRFLSFDSRNIKVSATQVIWALRNDDEHPFVAPMHHSKEAESISMKLPHSAEMPRISVKWRGAEDPYFTVRKFVSR